MKEVVAEQALELRLLKKHDREWGRPNMRLPASEKLEIIGLVEQLHLPARRTLQMLGIKASTFLSLYDRYRSGGQEARRQAIEARSGLEPHSRRDPVAHCQWRLSSQNLAHASWQPGSSTPTAIMFRSHRSIRS